MNDLMITSQSGMLSAGDRLRWSKEDKRYVISRAVDGDGAEDDFYTYKMTRAAAQNLVDTEKAVYVTNKSITDVVGALSDFEVKYEAMIKEAATADVPECIRVEAITVYENLLKLIKHIKNLNG